MDIVQFISDQIALWNTEEKCGKCWHFEAPLTESALNESVKKTDDCCVRVFLTELNTRDNIQWNSTQTFPVRVDRDYNFRLHFVEFGRIDTNNYQEQEYPIDESKWETILRPLEVCINEGFDYCDLPLLLIGTSKTMRINWLDNNYTGWTVNFQIRETGL